MENHCNQHNIEFESDDCPVCYLMKFLADDQKENFNKKFPVEENQLDEDWSSDNNRLAESTRK